MGDKVTSDKFFNSLKVYIEKPHVINKKICGIDNKCIAVKREATCDILSLAQDIEKIINSDNFLDNGWEKSSQSILLNYGFHRFTGNENSAEDIPWSDHYHQLAIVRKIFPKNVDVEGVILELLLIDIQNNKFVFVPKLSTVVSKIIPEFSYVIFLDETKINIKTFTETHYQSTGFRWLNRTLLPTLLKWFKYGDENIGNTPSSLCLVNVQCYNNVYQRLKRKYTPHLMEIWCESTDPQKFIHEDIAIAAYLIVLWDDERKSKNLSDKQSFLDLGCGNGLLVYILSMEGHQGMGIDIKRRKLWDKFPNKVCLKEDAIIPSDKYLYPEYDWLIGNHSDELTPWLPVISAKSSLTSRYFIIPCCAHDFNSKFQRSRSGISLYSEYLDYIKQIGIICGFEVCQDKLRIPSTKRTCFVGQNRNYKLKDWTKVIETVDEFVRSRCQNETKELSESWCTNFKPREAIQKPRNCTQIDGKVKEKIINIIVDLLLSRQNFIQVEKNDKLMNWNRGGNCTFKDLINILGSDRLKHLKNECGGLQTLIRNHRFIFEIQHGFISLRMPEPKSERIVKSNLLKTKLCWFDSHHPQGCTLKGEECTYIHL